MSTETKSPLFYPGSYPWNAISTYMGEDRPFRIALDDQIVVGMNSAAQTIMLACDTREVAEDILAVVHEQLPEAAIREIEAAHVGDNIGPDHA